jgi:hypothetical protein
MDRPGALRAVRDEQRSEVGHAGRNKARERGRKA